MNIRYFLSTDNDAHWYIIPEEYRDAWDVFCDLDPDDEECWNVPTFAQAIGGHPSQVTFENPKCS